MEIFNKLNEIPHLQEIIIGHYKSALNKDHEEHDEKKLYAHHYETEIFLECKIPDDAYEYRLPIISDEVNKEILLLCEGLKHHLKKYCGWSNKKIKKRWVKQWVYHISDYESMYEIWIIAKKKEMKRLRILSKKYCSAIKIQSVVRGWLTRR